MNNKKRQNQYFVMMKGIPGAGKSTFSKAIAVPLRAVVIENDVIKDKLLKLLKPELAAKISYKTSCELLARNVNSNLNIIFDSCAMSVDEHNDCKTLANKHKFIVCECYCSNFNVWRKRLKNRPYSWQDNDHKIIRKRFERWPNFSVQNLIRIDTSKPLKINIAEFLKFIKSIEKAD